MKSEVERLQAENARLIVLAKGLVALATTLVSTVPPETGDETADDEARWVYTRYDVEPLRTLASKALKAMS